MANRVSRLTRRSSTRSDDSPQTPSQYARLRSLLRNKLNRVGTFVSRHVNRWLGSIGFSASDLRVLFVVPLRCANYYMRHAGGILATLGEMAPFLQPEVIRYREIRVTPNDEFKDFVFEDGHWQVWLRECCVVCGRESMHRRRTATRSVPSLFATTLVLVLATLLIVTLMIVTGDVRWLWLYLVAAAAGYAVRSTVPVKARFIQCPEHEDEASYPRLRTFRRRLIVRVGDSSYKWRVMRLQKGDSARYPDAAIEPRR